MKFLLSLFYLMMSFLLFGQGFNKAKLDSLFNILEKENQAMGSVAISQNGKIVYQRAIGFIENQDNTIQKANENSKYRMGSISKMFTAVLIFQLIEAKKLKLETKLSKFFKTIPNSDKITIAHLLQHRSGIFNFTDAEDYAAIAYTPQTQAKMVELISSYPTDFQPDSKTSYSNSNFVLLGFIIEKIYKKTYAEVLKIQICDKIGLKNTYFSTGIDTKNNEANSFAYIENWEKMPPTHSSVCHGAGALAATAQDLNIFIESLFACKLVSEKSLKTMQTVREGLGMGMFSMPFYTQKSWGHNGSIDGFEANLAYFETEKLAIAYCSNGVNYEFNEVLIGILSIYFDKQYELPSFKFIELSEEYLQSCEGLYSCKKFPLKISLIRKSKKLFARAEGQAEFPLTAIETDVFEFKAANIVIKMKANKSGFNFKQNGQSFEFEK